MKNDFVAEILRATGSLRAGDPAGATDIIKAALSAGGLSHPGTSPNRADDVKPPREPGNAEKDCIESSVVAELAGDVPEATTGGQQGEAIRFPRLRKSLGGALRTLSQGRKSLGLEGRRPVPARRGRVADLSMPEGAEFRDLTYACAAGARRYRLYVPASASEGLQGLVVMLHGCTQDPEDFAVGTGMNAHAEEHRLLVAYPAQTGTDNPMCCWNWFRPDDQMRGAGEPAIIAGLTESLRDDFAIRRERVFIAGLSAGGAMAAIMAETYPDLYSAAGIHSGLAYGCANDVMSAFSAMQGQAAVQPPTGRTPPASGETPRFIVFHGSADTTVHPANAERIIAGRRNASVRVERFRQPASGESRGYMRTVATKADGATVFETWIVDGAQHAWLGGNPNGSYSDPQGPNASAEMIRFFLAGAPTSRSS